MSIRTIKFFVRMEMMDQSTLDIVYKFNTSRSFSEKFKLKIFNSDIGEARKNNSKFMICDAIDLDHEKQKIFPVSVNIEQLKSFTIVDEHYVNFKGGEE